MKVSASEAFLLDGLHNAIEHVANFGGVGSDTQGCGRAPWVNPATFLALQGAFGDGNSAQGGAADGPPMLGSEELTWGPDWPSAPKNQHFFLVVRIFFPLAKGQKNASEVRVFGIFMKIRLLGGQVWSKSAKTRPFDRKKTGHFVEMTDLRQFSPKTDPKRVPASRRKSGCKQFGGSSIQPCFGPKWKS